MLGTNPPGAYFSVYLNPALGSVQSFKSPNNAVGTRTEDVFDSGWGFKFTTGVISGSDGTPGFQQCDGNDCFFWVDAGYDMATSVSAARNIVMVAGAVARSTGSGGNLFHRVGKMHLVIPEPSSALGLAACLVALLGIATLRQRR